ncbi:hypothetical protein KA977_09605 [Candidatus Dependentiae bacterium]|nr:hypothetical protein [Candidatus Dependentiae bacterium]
MNISFLIKCVFILLLVSKFQADCFNGSKFNTKFSLIIHNTTHMGTDYIEIQNIDDTAVYGKVGIDWSIGPQAREQLEHEKFYILPFSAKLIDKDKGFNFEVNIANRKIYDFNLFFIFDKELNPRLVGFVKIKNSKKNLFPPEIFGALATPF